MRSATAMQYAPRHASATGKNPNTSGRAVRQNQKSWWSTYTPRMTSAEASLFTEDRGAFPPVYHKPRPPVAPLDRQPCQNDRDGGVFQHSSFPRRIPTDTISGFPCSSSSSSSGNASSDRQWRSSSGCWSPSRSSSGLCRSSSHRRARCCPRQPTDLHRADRSVLALHRHRAPRGCRPGVAVRPLSVLAAHRASALLAPEEVRDPVRGAHERRRRRRRGVQPLHRVPLHDRVLRYLQLHRRRVPAPGRDHLRSVREDGVGNDRGLPDSYRRFFPRQDGARDGAIPLAQHEVRDSDHLHHRGGRDAVGRSVESDDLRHTNDRAVSPEHRHRLAGCAAPNC